MMRWRKCREKENNYYSLLLITNPQWPIPNAPCPMAKYLHLRIIYLYAVSSIKNGKRHKFRLILFTVKDFILQR